MKKLYVPNVAEWEKSLSEKRFSDKKLEIKIIERGIILPAQKFDGTWKGGVCDGDLKFISGFSRKENNKGGGFATVNASYEIDRKEIVYSDEDVIFGGSLIGHFGHFMMECWNRLYYVIENREIKSKIAFITTTHGGYHSWFDEFFALMGIEKERIIYVKKPLQFRSVTVPEQSQYGTTSFTKEFLVPYEAIKSRIKPSEPKKLYLTRSKFEADDNIGVHCYNEKYFEDFFAARGFEVVSMEKLSVAEQISLMTGAQEVAATIGTLTHWAMFCKPETKFTMLIRTDGLPLALQAFVNQISAVDYYLVDASKNFLYANRNIGVCLLGSNRHWKEFVANYFSEQIEEDDDNLYFETALDKYVNFWCKKYSGQNNFDTLVGSLKDMCNRIAALENELLKKRPLLRYQTHVGRKGWLSWRSENQLSTSLDLQLDIQAIKINFSKPFHEIYYAVYFDDGWSAEVSTGQQAGTTGKSKSITGIKIRLDEAGATEFNIFYRVHKFGGVWSAWAKNGEELFSQVAKISAIQIRLESIN